MISELRAGRRVARVAAFIGVFLGGTGVARAADSSAAQASCDAAFETAELRLRPSEGRLLEARAALLACALPSCKTWMIDDCSKRVAEVDGRIPSVVFSAEDAHGTFLEDVRVLEGGREIVGHLDGRAVEMDPGAHELVAERGSARVPMSVVVIEGKKAQQVTFAFAPRDATGSSSPASPEEGSRALAYPWARPVAGGMLAGGIVATALGAGLLAVAVGKKSDANCDAANICDGGPLESARDAAGAATVAFVVGGALALGAGVTFLAFGRTRVQAAAWVDRVQMAARW